MELGVDLIHRNSLIIEQTRKLRGMKKASIPETPHIGQSFRQFIDLSFHFRVFSIKLPDTNQNSSKETPSNIIFLLVAFKNNPRHSLGTTEL